MPESLTHSGCVCIKKGGNVNNKLGGQILLNIKTKYSKSCHLNNNPKKYTKHNLFLKITHYSEIKYDILFSTSTYPR